MANDKKRNYKIKISFDVGEYVGKKTWPESSLLNLEHKIQLPGKPDPAKISTFVEQFHVICAELEDNYKIKISLDNHGAPEDQVPE